MNWAHSSLNPPIPLHRVHTQPRPAQPGPPTRTRPGTHTAPRRPRVQPARLRFACCRQRRGRWGIHNPGCRRTGRHPGKAGKGPLPKLPGRVLCRAAADRRNTSRATMRENSRQPHRAGSARPDWRRPCTQVQSRSCACVQIGVWAGAGPVLTPVRRLRHRQCHFSAGAAEGKFAY